MTTTMAALASNSIIFAEFVKLTTPSATYTFCNAAAPITVDGTTFAGLGSLLNITNIDRQVKATSGDLGLSLTGIDSANIAIILSATIKGSKIEIWRGFLDSNNQIITSPTQQFFKRYQGLVSNIAINEDFNTQERIRIATCILTCASFRSILQNRVGGVRTNPSIWKTVYPNDTSMDRVPIIAATYFDFGAKPLAESQAEAAAAKAAQQAAENVGNNNSGGF
jgi:hypothetical protein